MTHSNRSSEMGFHVEVGLCVRICGEVVPCIVLGRGVAKIGGHDGACFAPAYYHRSSVDLLEIISNYTVRETPDIV